MLLFTDSFDHYVTADQNKKWTTLTSTINLIIGATGRNASQGVRFTFGSAGPAMAKSVGSNAATLIAGAAFKYNTGYSTNNDFFPFAFFDNTTKQIHLTISTSGILKVVRGDNATVLATANVAFAIGSFYYIEFKSTIHNTTGTYALRVNGAVWGGITDATSQNTRGGSTNNFANIVQIGNTVNMGGGTTSLDVDDLYICDATGSVNNDFLSDIRVECLYPSGAGASTQFTASTGSNVTTVDEATANTTDYVTSTADNQIDTYAFGDLSEAAAVIKAVQVTAYAEKTDVGSRSLALVDRTNATNHVGSDHALSTSFVFISDVLETDSGNGGIAWTLTNLNAAEFGIKDRP